MVPGSNPGVPYPSFCDHHEPPKHKGSAVERHHNNSPTRIRTAVAGFRVLSANHYTMGDG